MKKMTSVLAGTACSLTLATSAFAEKWDMPVAYPATNFHTETAVAFTKCVADSTKGGLEIVTHANGSLFAGNDIKRAVQTGQAPIGERLLSAHANENPLFAVDSIPFLASSFDASNKLWSAAREKVSAALEAQNLIYVYAVPWAPQGLFTKKPVASAADLKGVKFRAYNAATARIAELAGMVPVQIEAAELSQALATGIADSFVSSGSTGVDSKVWDSLKYFYDVQAWLPRNVVFVNKGAYDGLDDASKKALMDCGAKAAEAGEATSRKLTAQYLKTFAENGMTVSDPTAQLKNDLHGYGATMTDEWLAKAGADGKAIIDAYKAK
ncbi:C4-dicarboxylate ABC transporter substrate-binding protein [Brucella endophytica]|uniref:C4-dicarboxylate ABC transporter substrate-binding protein n=1 Tax=Brucella endophytica TaxID=1963359 RepID=A0A916SCV0_9HYPH|nr:TRAP transporter substrate-binding protein [Brucella endophytica]GGA93738.1 C4-dicarboxylate ABC transporter substrate-binding protein [Brucella endophytica]